ncbi:hypothetical protein NDI37_14365 [Funiculus sociatus GB2-A5]|uniref:Uncharacterized protein n=1 Tax=Funiculus sociatus GB2-A5 TaxID=2933946 RepID=A0ABV0JQF1_9CYAN|nr:MULTISPECIES: hypothetical protein [unclassified Trichocoleus]MBD1905430.1 hypothetical protein [Trichocoleus sp. FACHB-832]MBD2061851.1 hypothetical protein [Trichocoleus sp. FACHB-6]
MKLERKAYRDGNLYPEVFNYLRSLPDNVLFHSKYGERHPLSIYNLSVQRIIQAFKAVLDEIDQICTTLFDANGHLSYRLDKLTNLQKELLHSLQSHIDDCYRILKTLHPPDPKIKETFVERWLEKAKHPTYKHFQDAVKDYRNSFALIVNKIKHNGGQLRAIMMYSRGRGVVAQHSKNGIKLFPRDARIVGYFLEGMQPDGCIGPDCDIHPDGKTAISLNRDLRFHFANFYRVGHHLKTAIVKAVRSTHGVDLPYPGITEPVSYGYDIEQIAERISRLPPLFFENEFSKATPNVTYYRSNRGAEVILEFPGYRQMTWYGDVTVYAEIQLDSVSPQYRVPYMNK